VTEVLEWDSSQYFGPFEVGADIVDLGPLELLPYVRGKITAQGLASWEDFALNVYAERAHDQELFRELYFQGRKDQDEMAKQTSLLAGEYRIVICDAKGKRLWRGDLFEAVAGQELDLSLHFPSPTSIGAEGW